MIVTSFSRDGYEKYGKRCLETFLKHWTDETLYVFYERALPEDHPKDDRLKFIDLYGFDEVRTFCKFIEKSDPIFRGIMRDPTTGSQVYNFRLDAYKFFRKAFAISYAGKTLAGDELYAWLDADTYFHTDVPLNFLRTIIADEKIMIAHLNREWLYTETGFLVLNPKAVEFDLFLDLYIDTYFNGAFRYLAEWHDCYVLDFVMRQLGVPSFNMTVNEKSDHPFNESVIGRYASHLKGPKRKKLGKALDTDVDFSRQAKAGAA